MSELMEVPSMAPAMTLLEMFRELRRRVFDRFDATFRQDSSDIIENCCLRYPVSASEAALLHRRRYLNIHGCDEVDAEVDSGRLRVLDNVWDAAEYNEQGKMSGKNNCHTEDSWEFLRKRPVAWCKKISAAGGKMTLETSPKGGFDIEIGSYRVHLPKHSSVHDPLIQMVLFAYTLYDSTLRCLNLFVPQNIVEFNKSALLTKPRSHPPNTVSARKGVHVLADNAPKNHSITPGLDNNIPKFGELDYIVDLSTVPVHSGCSALENVYNLNSRTSVPSSAVHGITKAEDEIKDWRVANIAKAEDKIEDCRLANIPKEEDNSEVTWLMATAAVHHATGIRDLLSGFTTIQDLFVKAGDGVSMPVCGRGSVTTGAVVLQDVWFVPSLTENLVSVTQLTDLDYSVGFSRAACIIRSATDDAVIGKAHVSKDGLFEVDFLKVGPVI